MASTWRGDHFELEGSLFSGISDKMRYKGGRVKTLATTLLAFGAAVLLASSAAAQTASSDARSKIYPSTVTGAPDKIVYDEASAMQWFRTLTGTWVSSRKEQVDEHKHDTGKGSGYGGEAQRIASSSFKTIAAGSTVMETYLEGTPYEMTLMMHMDGPNKLLINHYCAARNVPQMRFVKTGKPGEIKFVFDGGTNLNPQVDDHAHDLTYQVIDKNTYSLSGTVYKDGKGTTNQPTVRH